MHDASTLPNSARASDPVKADWCTPPIRCTKRSGTSDHPNSTANTKSPKRMEPCVLTQSRQSRGRRSSQPRVGPGLGQEQQLEREPDQGEVEPPVAGHEAGDTDGEQDDNGGDPAARAPRARAYAAIDVRQSPPSTMA